MNYTVKELENNWLHVDVTVPYDEFSVYVGRALDSLCQQNGEEKCTISEYIEKHGKEELFYRGFNVALGEAYHKLIDENAYIVVSQPKVDLEAIGECGADTKFSVEIEIFGEITLGKYKGFEIQLKSKTPSVTVEEIERKKKEIALSYNTWEETDASLENGHMSVIDFEGSVDGVLFEGGSAQDYELLIGSGMFIPGFESQMVGMVKGETRIIKVQFPENYTPELAGKNADFKVTLKSIKERVECKVDDTLVEKYASDKKIPVTTMEQLERILREEIYRAKENACQKEIASAIENALYKGTTFDVPESVIEEDAKYQLQSYEQQARMYGMDVNTMLGMMGMKSVDDLMAELKEGARKNFALQVIIDAIIKAENLEATDEELDSYYDSLSKAKGVSAEVVKKELTRARLKGYILTEKALKLVRDSSNIIYA